MTFEVTSGKVGRRLIVTGTWTTDAHSAFRSNECSEIELNDAKGWRGGDIGFLRHLDPLDGLVIISSFPYDASVVADLVSLRYLELQGASYGDVDFSSFDRLTSCGLTWRNGTKGIANVLTLTDLFIDYYEGRDCTELARLSDLRTLVLLSPRIDRLDGLEVLKRIERLRLGRALRLSDIRPISALSSLKALEIVRCKKIDDIWHVGDLVGLRRLELVDCGEISSISWVSRLSNLTECYFYGDTNIVDGDLSALTRIPSLRKVVFKPRRHYSHDSSDFILPSRS